MDTVQNEAPQIEADLDRESAPAWRPAPGEKVVGVVADISEREGQFGRYPIVTLRTEAGELAFTLSTRSWLASSAGSRRRSATALA